jgi:hypothetical protein
MPNDRDLEDLKEELRQNFNKNVRGKRPDVSSKNVNHDGKYGHWLEAALGIKANNLNKSDVLGFELKNNTKSKTTFGDWSSNDSIFKRNSQLFLIDRERFLEIFGKPNLEKNGRYSWSGEPFPKIGNANTYGQWMEIDSYDNIYAKYSYSKDLRVNKSKILPADLKKDNLTLAIWYSESLKGKVERKFNNKGWCKCLQNDNGEYTEIIFGDPFTFNDWISWVKSGDVFLDSGMYQGNSRPYANWRADNNFWDKLLSPKF